jgi:N-formylglutamate amidohydrolase
MKQIDYTNLDVMHLTATQLADVYEEAKAFTHALRRQAIQNFWCSFDETVHRGLQSVKRSFNRRCYDTLSCTTPSKINAKLITTFK